MQKETILGSQIHYPKLNKGQTPQGKEAYDHVVLNFDNYPANSGAGIARPDTLYSYPRMHSII